MNGDTSALQISALLFDKCAGVEIEGEELSEQQIQKLLLRHFPGEPYCVVENWIIVDVNVTDSQREQMKQRGYYPSLVYAHSIIFDSQGRWERGRPVRTSPQVVAIGNILFKTHNTVYVLSGPGRRGAVSIDALAHIM
ncbi:DUF6957 family protein [Halopseudomonas sp.]|jgi:hypothetical protein|uniref:DUF6957 family protein n=1 Tax=Halopseudomonas sp. TaxID=2901191 RepID=UPI0039E63182